MKKIIYYYGKGYYESNNQIVYNEAHQLQLNVELAHQKLGWKLMLNQDEMVQTTVDWYKFYAKNHDAITITNQQIEKYMLDLKF